MNDHTHYEQLTALAAGGHLSDEEMGELQRHIEICPECSMDVEELRDVVRYWLPLAPRPLRQRIGMFISRPDPGARERFIRRASLEGVRFSAAVKKLDSSRSRHVSLAAAGVAMLATIVIAASYVSQHLRQTPLQLVPQSSEQTQQQLDRLKQQNSALDSTVSQLNHALAEQHNETEGLRTKVATLMASADNRRHESEQLQAKAEQSTGRSADSLLEAETQRKVQEKQLADAQAELARLNQGRASDQASIVADQVRINDLSEQLRTAKASIDVERQFAAAGKDVRDLMGARQLHVVDVRDTDPNGKSGKAFGRVFLTEGKSLIFYAFDLNDAKRADAKQTYQVWGQQEGKTASPRSLGFLYVDDKAQRRWALKTEDPAAIKEIDSVFVTVEPPGGAKKPSGQRLLYAYLGEANHP
jgi:hypothetical protein